MKILAQVLCGILLCVGAMAQDHASHMQTRPITLVTGLGDLHHPVSTHNQQAQQFFDQGLRFIYAFNHDEAARSFQHAAELDPKLAMAYWGIAEAVGPNYNDPADPERYKRAHDAAQKAVDLSAGASANEQAYLQAMAKRFPADANSDLKKAAEEYHDAMRKVSAEFPDDLEAATAKGPAAGLEPALLSVVGSAVVVLVVQPHLSDRHVLHRHGFSSSVMRRAPRERRRRRPACSIGGVVRVCPARGG